MEAPTRPERTATRAMPAGPAVPVTPGDPVRPRAVSRTRLGCLVTVAGLVAACVAPTAGGPGPTSGKPSLPAGPPTIPPGSSFVPPGLAGKTWVAPSRTGSWLAGISGLAARLAIPDGELPIEATSGLVASASVRADQTGSVVRVRDVATGRLITEVSRPENVGSAVFVADRVLVAGHDPLRTGVDPGVVSVSLADGSAAELVTPGPLPSGWTGSATRSLIASPSGRTVVSGLCLVDRCAIELIDPRAVAPRQVIDDIAAFPVLATDQVVILKADDLSTIAAYDLATGRRLWQRDGAEFQYGYLTADGRYVVSYLDHREPWRFVVSVVDPLSNDERVVLQGDPNQGLTLWPELSSDDLAVLGTGGRFEDVSQASPVVRASVLDLASGELVPGGLTIVVAR